MSSNGRVLPSGGQAGTHNPISTASVIRLANNFGTPSTPTEMSPTTRESECSHSPPTPLPRDDEWAANLKRVVFVPSVALATAKNNSTGFSTHHNLTCSPAHVMLFPKTKEEALNIGIRLKAHKDARADAIPPEERRKISLPKRVNGGTKAIKTDQMLQNLWRSDQAPTSRQWHHERVF